MAVDYFLKVETPDVKGESENEGFKEQMMLHSWSWGGSNVSTVSGSGGSGAGKADISDLNVMINFDAAVPKLFEGLTKGTHFGKGTLSAVKTGAAGKPYLIVTMTELFVTSVQLSASGEVPTVSASFSYKTIEIEYKKQDAKGTLTTAGKVKYDLSVNKAE